MNTNNLIRIIIKTLITVAFLGAGIQKLTGNPGIVGHFVEFGYPMWFMYFIGVAQIAGAAGLWYPKLSMYACIGLLITMAGAIVSHTLVHDPAEENIPIVILSILLFINIFWKDRLVVDEKYE